ncbi:calcineurin-binding protein cabin-1-like isoform X2 [Euwallacea fornicatus]|uniref:calcineurin-binding protein cabin-1-like isoform X2 n=1 Tax=Euwallacea fornicatus TaxID=995702 RepID=UPI00338D4E87
MLKIKALNQESSSDEEVPTIRREAQEEIALELYNNALRALAQKNFEKSAISLKLLLEENIPQLENNGGLPKSMSTLKYSCYVNLGNIYLSQENINEALDCFSNASELDSTDVTLWFKVGKLSLMVDKFNKAAYAFSKGLECSESHWPCLDNLISVLYAIRDTISCLVYIGKALTLDGEYTKGVVLRKQIYRDNPATKEYYQLYNPDHIYEPPVDIKVDKQEEADILKEAELLCERVTEVETTLGSKPFNTIPLPKSLEEYTWVSLTRCIIYCHQYITDHNMSHFTIFDTSKCMSQSGETTEVLKNKIIDDVPIIKGNKRNEKELNENGIETSNGNEENVETEPILAAIERRFSQTSENTAGNENQDTPSQTDNDEEQNMDLDNDETDGDNQGENLDTSDVAQQRKKGKRKRDVLSDLQIWGWHSKRKPPKKATRDFTVEDALNRIIPKHLLKTKITKNQVPQCGEESMNTMDLYNMYVENKELNFLSPIHSPKSVNFEAYFGTDRESFDVANFWIKKRTVVDAVVLVKELVFELAKLWRNEWPKELIPLYIEVYKMFREHCDQPQPFCGDHSFEQIREDTLATLLYGELLTFSIEPVETVHPTILTYLQIVSSWSEDWKDEYSMFLIRFYWLQSHCFRKREANELAIRALETILDDINSREKDSSEKFSFNVPNSLKYGFISSEVIEKIMKHLNMINSLGNIENLFNAQKYAEVADVLKHTFNSGSYSKVGRMGRPAQLGILMHSLWFTDWEDCFIWTEECLNEAVLSWGKPNTDQDKWEKIIEKCLGIFQEIIKKETVSIIDKLTEEKRSRLVESLAKIISKQLNTEGVTKIPLGTITGWIVLHYVLLREEQRQYANKRLNQTKRDKIDTTKENLPESSDEELPPSIAILFSAHEFLGPKGWCLTKDGELLHFILDTILDRLDTPIFEASRDKIDIHIEQALFCLYLYPSKKNKISRHLVDHDVNPIPLTWERSFQLYQYYAPDSLPEFNSYKNQSISADLEQLFKKIICLVPTIATLHEQLPKITDFIQGKVEKLPETIDFPGKVKAIYYLLGDYYFKEKEFTRCIEYYQLDICINPMRLDSWAALGLSYAAQVENSLNYCEKLKNESDFFDKAKSAQNCYRKALELDPENLVLWIECGSFEYLVHSFCSRLIKFESENFSLEKFELLETQKDSYLDSSGSSLEHAIALYTIDDSNEQDERWLQYYILGKIAEKKRKEPSEYLQHYLTACNLLNENQATYPGKINYNSPQYLSVEALELHYRVHASVLKYLELHEGKDIPNTLGTYFKKCLSSTAKRYEVVVPPSSALQELLPTPMETETTLQPSSSTTTFQNQYLNSLKSQSNDSSTLEEAKEIVKACLEDILTKVEEAVKESTSTESTVVVEGEKQGDVKDIKSDDLEDMDVTIIENDDVVMIISDSEDEVECALKASSNNKDESKMEVDDQKEVSRDDVQSMLDKMMEATMTDPDKLDNSDTNNSGAEHLMATNNTSTEEIVKDDIGTQVKVTTPPIKESTEKTTIVMDPTNSKPNSCEADTENKKTTIDEESTSSSSSDSSDSGSSDSESDDSDSSSSSSSSDSSNEHMSHSETSQLVDKCIHGLEICITRLPQNYKALYRLAHLFFNYKARKDYVKCKQLLLGEYKCKNGVTVNGLFFERNSKNFFNGIWRIPSTEIDRPGSLAAHMNRCISIMLQVLRNTNDTKTLMELSMQLRKVPDKDKIYIRDSDRISFSEQAMEMCVQSFRAQMKNIPNMPKPQVIKLLHDVFRVFQRVQKYLASKELVFSGLLTEVYKCYAGDSIADNANVLELAIKFCQQHRPVEKHRSTVASSQNTAFAGRGPGIGANPVLPTPGNLASPHKLMKPPGISRPRGRPPLPKVPGQARQSRAKSPSGSSYPWQSTMFGSNINYEYLKHYQEELIKQYSQNLNLTQLQQLTSYFSSGRVNSPGHNLTNQYLAQTSLLNSNLLRSGASGVGSGISTSASSFLDPNSLQKGFNTAQVPPLANLSQEQMKFLESMLPSLSKPASTVSSNTTTPLPVPKTTSSGGSKSNITLASAKMPASKFKEPLRSKSGPSEVNTANLLMKDRPNISIIPVGLPPTTTTDFGGSQNIATKGGGLAASITQSSVPPSFTSSTSSRHKSLVLPSFGAIKHPSVTHSFSSSKHSSTSSVHPNFGATKTALSTTKTSTFSSSKHSSSSSVSSSSFGSNKHLSSAISSTFSSIKHPSIVTTNYSSTKQPVATTISPSFSSTKHSSSISPSFSLPKQPTTASIYSSSDLNKPKLNTDVGRPKAAYMPTITSARSFSKSQFSNTVMQAPAAHTSPKSVHSLPVTPPPPPPVSSPSYLKTASPGKTLQQKLAEKKKEQETKQLMKNIEAEVFNSKLPHQTAPPSNILKGLNIPSIPSSLTVSPSMAPVHQVPQLIPEKQSSFPSFSTSSSRMVGRVGDMKIPSGLSVSQTLPPPVYTPRFPAESGVSLSQIASSNSPPKKRGLPGTNRPISVDRSVEISSVRSHSKSSHSLSPLKDSKSPLKKRSLSELSVSRFKQDPSAALTKTTSSNSKSKDEGAHATELIGTYKQNLIEASETKTSRSPPADFSHKNKHSRRDREFEKKYRESSKSYSRQFASSSRATRAEKHDASEKRKNESQALSVIKKLSSIDITPLPSRSADSVRKFKESDDDVIILE